VKDIDRAKWREMLGNRVPCTGKVYPQVPYALSGGERKPLSQTKGRKKGAVHRKEGLLDLRKRRSLRGKGSFRTGDFKRDIDGKGQSFVRKALPRSPPEEQKWEEKRGALHPEEGREGFPARESTRWKPAQGRGERK